MAIGVNSNLGFELDPYSMLVPFLVFAIGISHGVQIINGVIQQSSGNAPIKAAKLAFIQLFIPGMIAILADAVGFITLLVINIKVIHELAISASIGVIVIIMTNLIVLPIIMSFIGIPTRLFRIMKNI